MSGQYTKDKKYVMTSEVPCYDVDSNMDMKPAAFMDLAQEIAYLYGEKDLFENGYLKNATGNGDIDVSSLNDDGIKPLQIDEEMRAGVDGEIFKMNFTDRNNTLSAFENKWLPIPYFLKRGKTRFNFGPLNWSRFKIVPQESKDESVKAYKVLLAFDTRTSNTSSEYDECPVFSDFNNAPRCGDTAFIKL